VDPSRPGLEPAATKKQGEKTLETVELTLTPFYVHDMEKLPEKRSRVSHERKSIADEIEVEKERKEEEKNKVIVQESRRESNEESQIKDKEEEPLAKESRSNSLDSDLELSEEDSEPEERMEVDVEPERDVKKAASDADTLPRLGLSSNSDDLSDDERSHKRRRGDSGSQDQKPETGGMDIRAGVVKEEKEERIKEIAAVNLPQSPTKIDPSRRKFRSFLEELLETFDAEQRTKAKQLDEKRASLRQQREGYSYETFRDALRTNMKNLMGCQNQKSFENIVKSFCTIESDINRVAICDYIYSIFMVCFLELSYSDQYRYRYLLLFSLRGTTQVLCHRFF
jgi:hypothetical protein